MARREIERTYVALVDGLPSVDSGKIDAPIGRDPRRPTRMAVLPEGRPSVTWFRVLERRGTRALLEVRLETGRTHQIRVHMSAIGHPIVGDAVYGGDRSLPRPYLHATRLGFPHPITGERIEIDSELPSELREAW
jgi:23S rRNA pseudouridine1911/1915/1917 synthase